MSDQRETVTGYRPGSRLSVALKELTEKAGDVLNVSSLDIHTTLDLMQACNSEDEALFIMILALFDSTARGSICCTMQPFTGSILQSRLNALVENGILTRTPLDLVNAFESSISEWQAIIGTSATEYKPLVYVKDSSFSRLFFQKYAVSSSELRKLVTARLPESGGLAADNSPREVFADSTDLPGLILETSPGLNREQAAAVYSALTNPLTIITGGPGTGKTRISATIVTMLINRGIDPGRIILCAPTGRAARKLKNEAGRNQAQGDDGTGDKHQPCVYGTIHRVLGYSGKSGRFTYSSENPLSADWLIVDEVSMIDMEMMTRLLGACTMNTSIVLCGDSNQLPSVGAGAVLHDLVKGFSAGRETSGTVQSSSAQITIELVECYRTAGNAFKMAEAIRNLELKPGRSALDIVLGHLQARARVPDPWQTRQDKKNCFLVPALDTDGRDLVLEQARSWVNTIYGNAEYTRLVNQVSNQLRTMSEISTQTVDEIFDRYIDQARILALTNRGGRGTTVINLLCCEDLANQRQSPVHTVNGYPLTEGCPVMVTANNYRVNLFNGDCGVVVTGRDAIPMVLFKGEIEAAVVPLAVIGPIVPAFAITIHKSQGSEYNHVLTVLPESIDTPLLTREIIYTALTRSRVTCTFTGDRGTLEHAVERKIEREGGIIIGG
jgi:exodeoxyribonuclease V alpha subunit